MAYVQCPCNEPVCLHFLQNGNYYSCFLYYMNLNVCVCVSSAILAPNESTLRQNFQQIQEGESRQANRPILLPAYKPGAPQQQQPAEQQRAKPSPVPQRRTDVVRNDNADQEQRRVEQAPPPQPKMGRLIRKLTCIFWFDQCTVLQVTATYLSPSSLSLNWFD